MEKPTAVSILREIMKNQKNEKSLCNRFKKTRDVIKKTFITRMIFDNSFKRQDLIDKFQSEFEDLNDVLIYTLENGVMPESVRDLMRQGKI